ncbi:MAG: DUF962 domain-containing protein [Acidobacteria bacterium]|nr:DUF962 domain-containing protein [Acidobacteriota bacterium]
MSVRIERLFADYATHHTTKANQLCHTIGIPLIAFGLLGLLATEVFRLAGRPVEVSLLVIAGLAIPYLWLDVRLGAALTVVWVVLYLGARLLSWQWNLSLFIIGWVFQFIGHGVYEKRSPAFFTNLVHRLVGPLWVLNLLAPWPLRRT